MVIFQFKHMRKRGEALELDLILQPFNMPGMPPQKHRDEREAQRV
jgi:hypothetical protein